MIDAHVHFWQYDEIRDSWIDESMQVIRRDFFPSDINELLANHQVSGIVAVQADQSAEETAFLLKLAEENKQILGVVGWIDLQRHELERQLQEFQKYPKLKGWRHIVQAEPQGFLSNPVFIESVRKLGTYNYTYDVLVYHSQLQEATAFARKLPDQKLILDHLGKPDLKNWELQNWKKILQHWQNLKMYIVNFQD